MEVLVEFANVSKLMNDLRSKLGDFSPLDKSMEQVALEMKRKADSLVPVRSGRLRRAIKTSSTAVGVNQYKRKWIFRIWVDSLNLKKDPPLYARFREEGGLQVKKTVPPQFAIPIGPFWRKEVSARKVISSPGSYGFVSTFTGNSRNDMNPDIIYGTKGSRRNRQVFPIFMLRTFVNQSASNPAPKPFIKPASEIAVAEAMKVLQSWRL